MKARLFRVGVHSSRPRFALAATAYLVLCVQVLVAAEPDPKRLTLDRIFASGEFQADGGPGLSWSTRRGGYFTWEGGDRELVWHDTGSERLETIVRSSRLIPPGQDRPIGVESHTFSADESKLLLYTNSQRVWRTRSRGDYYVLDVTAGELQRIGGDAAPSTLMFAKFSPDGERVAYVRENNLYVQDLHTRRITVLTTDGTSRLINGTFDWVYEEELSLRDGFRWSPDGTRIAYWQVDSSDVREMHLVNNTDGLYSRIQTIPYPKVGETNSRVRIGVVDAAGGATTWIPVAGDPRDHYLAYLEWGVDSDELLIQQFDRLQQNNLLLAASTDSPNELDDDANPRPSPSQTILTERDAAWVEQSNAAIHWLDGRASFLWLSERDGWQHIYRVSRKTGESKLITPGSFDVVSLESVDEASGWCYYIAAPDRPTQRYLFRAKLDGSVTERVTPADQPGTHQYDIAPDGKFAVHSFSKFDSPPVVELISFPGHQRVRLYTDNQRLKEALQKLDVPTSEFFRVEVAPGVPLDGWCLKPPAFDETKKYPVVFHVYGEPAGQTVVDRWGGRNFLWHMLLAQKGYVVISIDNRGTAAPRGREWRRCIYRQVGQLASADQAAATEQLLKTRPYLDRDRIGIWGWSGGGSMTLNAMFRYPQLYKTGMSIAPVPNQRLYDTIYQERYMGLPGDNSEGYRLGSPVHFAHQLAGKLLLVHGTGDDNCHYQGTEQLINELIAHNKPFSMMAYPNRSHSISEGKNTSRHLYGVLTNYLETHVPAGPLSR